MRKLVNITYDWDAFTEYAEFCRVGTWQERETTEGIQVRVRAGRIGYIHNFKRTGDLYEDEKLLTEIRKFCQVSNYIKIEGAISDEQFHK